MYDSTLKLKPQDKKYTLQVNNWLKIMTCSQKHGVLSAQ
jgi:hypothetical protein